MRSASDTVPNTLPIKEGLLAARNIPVEGRLDDEAERIAAMPREAMLKAGLECTDLDDFPRCLHSEH